MFHYSQQDLYCENVALADIARQAGTPAYVYSSAAILENYRAYDEALGDLPHAVCYAVKANSTLGILSFNCESEPELALIDALAARRGVRASFAIRVNPDVDAVTHPYISTGLRQHKFGIAIAEAEALYERARSLRNLVSEGVSCHIGSQLMDTGPIL